MTEDAAEVETGVEQPKLRTVEEVREMIHTPVEDEPSLLDLSDELSRCQNKLLFINDCFIMRNPNMELSFTTESIEGLTLIIRDVEEKIRFIADKMIQTKE